MSSLCRFALLAVGLALVMGCQDKKQAPPPEPVPVQVRDSSGVLVAELKARLANFKIPKRCFVLDELPRNTMGKVQKALLREQYKGLFTS